LSMQSVRSSTCTNLYVVCYDHTKNISSRASSVLRHALAIYAHRSQDDIRLFRTPKSQYNKTDLKTKTVNASLHTLQPQHFEDDTNL
jgi:hypothetical protein